LGKNPVYYKHKNPTLKNFGKNFLAGRVFMLPFEEEKKKKKNNPSHQNL